jgi:hypothetical protein
MRAKQAYYRPMRYWTLASIIFSLLFLAVLIALSAQAQVNGVPPSVTSPGFGGRQFNGVPPSVTSFGFGGRPGFHGTPPSVTSLGPNGFAQGPIGIHQPPPLHPANGGEHHHHGDRHPSDAFVYPYYVPYYPVMPPYDYGDAPQDQDSADAPDPYQGGPTIFDRRGPGTPLPDDYVTDPPKARLPRPEPPPDDNADATPGPAPAPIAVEPNTILVFKDGHKLEVGNYAIAGSNLFDLTPGHRQKVALADLDISATEKANDELGVDFKLPKLPD